MAVASRFKRGSGVYKCGCCLRMTRATGRNDNENNGLCAECYDYGGIDNEISDCGSTPELEAELARLKKIIADKGGDITRL
jgi:hypothetical protein